MSPQTAQAARILETEAAAQKNGLAFDSDRLDKHLDEAGIDVLIASSKHNIQYLLGGYRFFFFEAQDAAALAATCRSSSISRASPSVPPTSETGWRTWEEENGAIPVPEIEAVELGHRGCDAARQSASPARGGKRPKRIGVERAFLPADAESVLREAFPDAEIVDALIPLERLRAVKSKPELERLRKASDGVIDSMLAVIASHGPGTTKRELAEALRREEVQRGLDFEYCLIACGASLNRAPSDQKWQKGEVLSLDSGGKYDGYIGDLARMGVLGEPDSGADRSSGRGRSDPAGDARSDPRRRDGERGLSGGRGGDRQGRRTGARSISPRTAWG